MEAGVRRWGFRVSIKMLILKVPVACVLSHYQKRIRGLMYIP